MIKLVQHIYMIPLFISAALSLKVWKKRWPHHYRIFAVLLIAVLVVEILAILWKSVLYKAAGWNYQPSNLWLYNSFLIPQYLLYIAFYYRELTSKLIKKILVAAGICFTIFVLLNMVFIQSVYSINSYSIIFASIIVVFLTASYFEQVRKANKIVKLSAQPMIWISLGAFIFHSCNLPYMISLNYLIKFDIALATSIFYIYLTLNCIMYSFYIIALLCPPPHHR